LSSKKPNETEILLVGDISSAALDADIIRELPCRLCNDINEAVALAGSRGFAVIAVVMASLGTRLEAGLEALRHANQTARIYLFAQMYEEPIALELLRSGHNGANLADDYFICPLRTQDLYGLIPDNNITKPHSRRPITDIDTAQQKKDEVIAQLSRLALEDDLTAAKNRRYIREFLRQIIQHARGRDLNVTLLVFDIDDFKHYNDLYGHPVGDMILTQAVLLMQKCCRVHDVVGRIGGDEFAVVFWDRPKQQNDGGKNKNLVPGRPLQERRSTQGRHPREPLFIAERFQREFGSTKLPLLGPAGKGVLTISGGLASFPRDGETADELFVQADAALLDAKQSGKNTIYLVGKPKNNSTTDPTKTNL